MFLKRFRRLARKKRSPGARTARRTRFSAGKTKTPGGQGWLRAQFDVTICKLTDAVRQVKN
jgi:hypothetical protein